ncbi:MAG: AEC family transporter [Cellvibrionaceae bacterium]
MASFFETLYFALGITAPIFLLVILGIGLRRIHLIDDHFINSASALVFNIGLPTLLFINIAQTSLSSVINIQLIAVGLFSTLLIFLLLVITASFFVKNKKDQGVFIQGGFRGNLGIVGLAFCLNAYGDQGAATVSIYMAVLTILYNILAVGILTKTLQDEKDSRMTKKITLNILKNPIVISITFALVFSSTNLQLNSIVKQTGNYISDLTLPLALICIGGSISLKELRLSSFTATATTTAKLLVAPIIMIAVALPFGFTKMEMGIIFLMAAAPTATASYIMVQAMKGNSTLAANIVVMTTLGSILSVSLGIVLLRGWELI